MKIVKVSDKYSIEYKEDGSEFKASRYGEPWRSLCGDNLIWAMLHKIESLEADLTEELENAHMCGQVNAGVDPSFSNAKAYVTNLGKFYED